MDEPAEVDALVCRDASHDVGACEVPELDAARRYYDESVIIGDKEEEGRATPCHKIQSTFDSGTNGMVFIQRVRAGPLARSSVIVWMTVVMSWVWSIRVRNLALLMSMVICAIAVNIKMITGRRAAIR